jgi:peroxiredoxin
MRVFFILSLLTVCHLSSFAQKDFAYSINGNIKGLGDDSIVLFIRRITPSGLLQIDTLATKSKGDRFMINSRNKSINDAQIGFGGLNSRKRVNLFIEQGTIEISGDAAFLDNISITGTPGNDDYNSNKTAELKFNTEIMKLSSLFNLGDDKNLEVLKARMRMEALRDSINALRTRFISGHKNSPVSAIYLYVLQDRLSIEELEKFYYGFSDDVKSISYLRGIPEKIKARKATLVGSLAPDFITKDLNGGNLKLSDFRGRYVLIEFWASWCVPCRKENPALNKALDTYEKHGFSIIGITLDDSKTKWLKAIDDDHLRWIHASELSGFNNQVAKLYGVQPIPYNFLINPEGKIIARHLSGEGLIDELGKQLLRK